MGKPRMTQGLRDAVWAAVYVEVLSARGGPGTIPSDLNIRSVGEVLADPSKLRMEIAIEAANKAVRKLEYRLREP